VATENRPSPCQFMKRCPRCGCQRRFRCTGKFRVNANGKLVDIWLLFDCCTCGTTAKLPVLERVPASRVGRSRLQAFYDNDPDRALTATRDVALLRRAGFTAWDKDLP
jgi:hypothetical protein